MILVESRRIFEPILAHTENEALLAGVERQRGPWNRKELGTHAQKAAEGKDRVGDATAGDIEHDRLDLAKVFAARIDDAIAYQRCRVHDFRARAIRAPTLGADNRRAAGGLGRPRGGIRINACGHKMSPRGKMLGSACRRKASTREIPGEPRRLEHPRLAPSSDVRHSQAARQSPRAFTRSLAILFCASAGVNPALSDFAVGARYIAHRRLPYKPGAAQKGYWQVVPGGWKTSRVMALVCDTPFTV